MKLSSLSPVLLVIFVFEYMTYDDESILSLCSLTWWWRFNKQRPIILLWKAWPYLGPISRFLQNQSDCEICELLLLRCKCDRFSIRLKNCKFSHGIEIRSRDSIVIPLLIEENRAKFFSVSLSPS